MSSSSSSLIHEAPLPNEIEQTGQQIKRKKVRKMDFPDVNEVEKSQYKSFDTLIQDTDVYERRYFAKKKLCVIYFLFLQKQFIRFSLSLSCFTSCLAWQRIHSRKKAGVSNRFSILIMNEKQHHQIFKRSKDRCWLLHLCASIKSNVRIHEKSGCFFPIDHRFSL